MNTNYFPINKTFMNNIITLDEMQNKWMKIFHIDKSQKLIWK